MAMIPALIRLPEDLLSLLDARAAREGTSRAELIRRAVEALLEIDRRAEVDRRIIAGYQRIPQADDDLATFRERTGLEALQRLAAEETSPW
jgi:Arc/MetJ-type ribon-helix-helix transcriptional regulator